MTDFRVAVLGLGEAGYQMHLPALAQMQSVTIAGACDVDEKRRADVASTWKVPVFEDLERMLDEAKPNVLIIATPPDSHARICLQAIEAGCHIICEKPFTATLEEADTVMATADAAGKRIALNHEFREMPIFRAVLDEIGGSKGKDLVFAQLWQNMDMAPWMEKGWRGKMQRRTLHEGGVHLVDYLLALFGEKPIAVSATMSACGVQEKGADVGADAVAIVSFEFSNGRLAQILQHRLCKGETQYFELRADTRTASYRASFGGRARVSAGLYRSTVPHLRVDYGVSGLAWREVGNKRTLIARNPKDPRVVSTRHVLERSLDAFSTGGKPPATAQDGRDALEVINACYEAAAIGRRVSLSDADAMSATPATAYTG
ncbi:MAG TPA: Gfo/Idh/MocA family oxidoreductase [Gemmatimonadaceae bacterium]|nr:Gfo/Idh/MocA family oxidoreductase [Gemmatimonadaceae bacterium]